MNNKIKKVLWIYFEGNDFDGLHLEMSDKILMKYYNDETFTQNLKLKQKEIDRLSINSIKIGKREKRQKEWEKKQSLIFKLINFIKITNLRILIYPPPDLTPKLKKVLKLTKELVNKNNSKLYFVYLPTFDRYKTNFDDTGYNSIKDILNQLDIPLIDIHQEVFDKEIDPLNLFPFQMNGHYNVKGYKKVGETIYKFTKD